MEEGRKVRVVRCPKCQKHIAEPPDVLVYRCGGCDATLQAKSHLSAGTDGASEKADEESGTVLNEMSETKRESNGVEFVTKENKFLERKGHSSSSPLFSRSGSGDVLNYCSGSRGFGEPESSGCDQGRYRRPSKAPVVNGVATDSLSSHFDELIKTNVKGNGEGIAPNENATGFQKFGQMPDRRVAERDGLLIFHREGRGVEGSRCGTYPDEGPSDHHVFCGEKTNNQKLEGSDRAETVEKSRAELLRQLDELRNHLSRPGDASEAVLANKRVVPTNSYNVQEARSTGVSLANGSSSQLDQDNPIRRPSYFNDGQPASLMGGHGMNVQKSFPLMHAQNDIHGYMEPFGPQVPRIAPHHTQTQYLRRSSNDYFSGHYVETVPDPFISYPPYGFYEQPPCSCSHCHNKHWQMRRPDHPAAFCNRQIPIAAANNHMEYHLDNRSTCCTRVCNHANAPLDCFEPQPHVRKPTDLEYDVGGFRRWQPQISVLAKGNKRTCRPIADGAPFITCCNCSKLLQLPSGFSLRERNEYKLRCGACSNTISFTFDGKRLVLPHASQITDSPLEADKDSTDMMKEGLHVDAYITNGILNSNLYDYDISDYNIQSGHARSISSPSFAFGDVPMGKESMLNSTESEKRQGLSSSSTSEDEEYPYSIIAQRDASNSPVQPLEQNMSSPVAGLRLHEHFEHSPANQVMEKFGNGNRSNRSDQGSALPSERTIRQSSVKDASVATEIDCSYNEYSSSTICQDFVGTKKEEDRHKFSKGGESFFVGLIKSFRDFGRPSENDQHNVSINGHPVPDRLVRKAEKKAGRILPGHYWYDYRAGFWGVMGHQCLGIIPPFIEEFNYPMPKNCSGGDTGVFMNARELHQKDLDLLSDRGLPITRDKSYLVEISGRLFDEATGEELDNLGKLAPTVERLKHGFGMWDLISMV